MRDLILKMAISLDGFVSDLAGTNTWMFGADQQAKTWGVDYVATAGLHIMGSHSFLAMGPYWQTSTDQFAPPMNAIPKVVFSKQGKSILNAMDSKAVLNAARAQGSAALPAQLQPGADTWAQAHVADGDLAEEIAKLKAESGKPIMAHGGVSFARSLVAHSLVDQFALIVAPVALGQGQPLFADLAEPARLRLISSTAFPGGAVAQIYRPA